MLAAFIADLEDLDIAVKWTRAYLPELAHLLFWNNLPVKWNKSSLVYSSPAVSLLLLGSSFQGLRRGTRFRRQY